MKSGSSDEDFATCELYNNDDEEAEIEAEEMEDLESEHI